MPRLPSIGFGGPFVEMKIFPNFWSFVAIRPFHSHPFSSLPPRKLHDRHHQCNPLHHPNFIRSELQSSPLSHHHPRSISYVQGQTQEKRREYFYYIDHHGQLFLDDARIKNFTSCFKDKEFLAFFFHRLKLNETGNYEEEFPYLSPCGRERNYVRCDDVPIVFTHFLGGLGVDEMQEKGEEEELRRGAEEVQQRPTLSWGGADDKLTVAFEPQRICMLPSTGRVYHPIVSDERETSPNSPSKTASSIISADLPPFGLIKSSLAIELSKYFEFEGGEDEPPSHFTWMGRRHRLTNDLVDLAQKYSKGEE